MDNILSVVTPLTVYSVHIGTIAIPDPVQEAPRTNEGQPSDADKNGSNFISLASSTAKLLLRGVNETADTFPPLKSVTGSLCYILDNCEVWSSSCIHCARRLQVPQRTRANKQAIESLAPRVKALVESLRAPVPEGDINIKEKSRRMILER